METNTLPSISVEPETVVDSSPSETNAMPEAEGDKYVHFIGHVKITVENGTLTLTPLDVNWQPYPERKSLTFINNSIEIENIHLIAEFKEDTFPTFKPMIDSAKAIVDADPNNRLIRCMNPTDPPCNTVR